MAVSPEDLQRIYVQVGIGVPKSEAPFPLTKEMSDLWDQLEREVAEIEGVLDFPDIEMPEVEIPNAVIEQRSD